MGVALMSTLTAGRSGTASVNSSARTVSPMASCCASGNSANATSGPFARRQHTVCNNSSMGPSGERSPSVIRLASRLTVTSLPVLTSKTTTPTGEVSTSVSRSERARRSSRCVRALAMAVAAWDANSIRTSSSAAVKPSPPSLSARKKWPTCTPRWRIGVPRRLFERIRSVEKPSVLT